MTPEERASDALYEACEEMWDRPNAERLVAAAIREAVAEERTRCLRIAQQCAPLAQELHSLISDPIHPEHP